MHRTQKESLRVNHHVRDVGVVLLNIFGRRSNGSVYEQRVFEMDAQVPSPTSRWTGFNWFL